MSAKKEFWSKVIGEDWYNLFPEFWDSDYISQLLGFLEERYQQATVYPPQKDIFRAFKLCRVKDFKVLILGQDPYPDGSATGLAFANDENTPKVSPSLQKILDTVERECYDGFNVVMDLTLEEWAQQGVLLLNTALTVEKFNISSHTPYWKTFTQSFLKRLGESELTGLHVCLWGNHAKSYKYLLNDRTMYIHESTHPAAAHYNKIDWKCDHFNDINMLIFKNNGIDEVIGW